ncbi:MAG: type VI immunity family protein [Pseudomonadota bacterium]
MDELSKIDRINLLKENQVRMAIPGGLFMERAEKDYVGAMPALTGTLFFKDAHTPAVRDAICACFKEYEAIAKEHLTWLWREEPPDGKDCLPYRDAKPMPDMMKTLTENGQVSFGYTSGKQKIDAGQWEFQAFGVRGWKAKMGSWGLSVVRFAMPLLYVEEHPLAFQAMFVKFADLLNAVHGYGGNGLVLSLVRRSDNEPTEAVISETFNGYDVGSPIRASSEVKEDQIKTVSWLTAINKELLEKVGGMSAVRSELPMDWFALYPYSAGIVIQAGPYAETASVDDDPQPACYVLPNMLLKDVRCKEMFDLHAGSASGEARIRGHAAAQWLARFDVPPEELLEYKAKLLDEPKLSKETTLPGRL